MRFTILQLLGLATVSFSFSTSSPFLSHQRWAAQQLSSTVESSSDADVPIVLSGKNIDLTPALVEYVNKRIGGNLNKLASTGNIRECEVHLSVSKNKKVENGHRVEVTTNLKGITLHAKSERPDMYSSIDAVAHAMTRKLKKYKERRMDGYHGGSMGDDLMTALEAIEDDNDVVVDTDADDDEFLDPEAPVITNINSFDLKKGITVQEAVFVLDYTDHDFYVFRNAESDDINVVYKRNAGGVGHIQP